MDCINNRFKEDDNSSSQSSVSERCLVVSSSVSSSPASGKRPLVVLLNENLMSRCTSDEQDSDDLSCPSSVRCRHSADSDAHTVETFSVSFKRQEICSSPEVSLDDLLQDLLESDCMSSD